MESTAVKVYSFSYVKPHIAVDSSALIPPALGFCRVNTNRQNVLSFIRQKIGNVRNKSHKSIQMGQYSILVYVNGRISADAVKAQVNLLPLRILRGIKMLSIPGNSARDRAARRMDAVYRSHIGKVIGARLINGGF